MSSDSPNAGQTNAGHRQDDHIVSQSEVRHTWLEIIDIFSKLSIGLAGLVLSGVIGWATAQHNRQSLESQMHATERQIRNQTDSLIAQRRIAAAQVLISQSSLLTQASSQNRAFVLRVLQLVDPELVMQVGEILLVNATSGHEREQAKQIIAAGTSAARNSRLALRLRDGSKYREFGLDAAAVREYLRAYDELPEPDKERLSAPVASARGDYDRGDYSTAAQRLEAILRPLSPRFSTHQ